MTSMTSDISLKQPKPESKKYIDLISEVRKGEIKVPKFQRNFVWPIDSTAKLLDSIIRGYPIGTFILWETKDRLSDIKNIGNLELPPVPDGTKVQYVLDGQQRITSLYAAYLGAKIQKEGEKQVVDYSNIYVDLEADIDDDEVQIVVSDKPEGIHISLHKVLNALDFDDEIEESYEKEYRKRIRQYAQSFSTYDFSTIVLRRDDIDSAIEVFTRINTGGQTLTLFEIMSAKTYDQDQKFDMTDQFQKLIDELSDCKYNTISSTIILNVLALILSKNKECKRKVVLQLDKQQIIDTWDDVISALKESIDYFRTVYRIPVSALLPYDSLLVPFSYFFYYHKQRPNATQTKYLEEFFWRIALSYRYSSSTESKLAQDVKRIDLILKDQRPNYDDIKVYLNDPSELVNISFSAGSSYCKAILCLLAFHEPKDFQNNGRIILDNSWLKMANSRNYHHFFPKAYLRRHGIGNENSIVNITLVSAELNKRKINAKAPSEYIQGFLEENDQLSQALETHLIGNIDEFGITSDDYSIFLQSRAKRIYDELVRRLELRHTENRDEEEIRSLILKGESDSLEFKATMLFDTKLGTQTNKMQFIIAKTVSAFLNSSGGTLLIGVGDDGAILGLERDLNCLEEPTLDDFEIRLRQLIRKHLGETLESYIKVLFPAVEGVHVCLVKVLKCSKPTFVTFEGQELFFVRNGNSSIPKNRQEQSEYQKDHWKD